jgi:hypothetical protein
VFDARGVSFVAVTQQFNGVDPVWWSVFGREKAGGPQCQEPIHRTRRNTGAESLS